MLKKEATEALVAAHGDAITIVTEQAIGSWREVVPEDQRIDHVEVVGAMGAASSIGLGVALGQPGRKVLVLDGDGSLLMQLGSLVTIAGAGPANLFHFVYENGVYETSGAQPLPGEGLFDLEQMARGAGYRYVTQFSDGAAFRTALPELLQKQGPVFVSLRIQPEDGYKNTGKGPARRMDLQMAALREHLLAAAK